MDMRRQEEICPGLVPADEETLLQKRRSGDALEEIVALERAIHFGASYVYFRRVPGRAPMAVAYLYDWMERLVEAGRSRSHRGIELAEALREELTRLHRNVWSACEMPLVYVFLPTQVQIFHILRGPCEERGDIHSYPWKTIRLGAQLASALRELKELSARRLDDGQFWEKHSDPELRLDGAAFMALSQEIEDCRGELVKKYGAEADSLIKRLLILFVMIKYLEERRVFPENAFVRFDTKAHGFVDLLRAGSAKVLDFLDYLAGKDRFNGDVFHIDAAERKAIEGLDLSYFADLLGGRIEKGQRTFWRRYAFNELPVELISHLYEQFLPDQPGVVYTPPFLVSFILDEVLPLSARTPESFRVLDPACGSGVFLVGAFKRLVHRWRRDHQFADPDVETLKAILRNHVFGVDVEGDAVRLTMFSLCIALCDSIEPRAIWDHLHFDRLKDVNLFEGDFFERAKAMGWEGIGRFDLIVGNPPFRSELKPPEEQALAGLLKENPSFDLPDHQLALLFLEFAFRSTKPGGEVALVLPAGPLLYNMGSSRFRRALLEEKQVTQIVDFTHLSRVLFRRPRKRAAMGKEQEGSNNSADHPVAVLFGESREPDREPVLHVTVRRTVQADQKLMFEIDHYDLHFVAYRDAIEDPLVWKANFIGGGRIPQLMRRFGRLPTLGEFLKRAEKDRKWYSSEGYTTGKADKANRLEALLAKEQSGRLSDDERNEFRKLSREYRKAPWLTGRRALLTEGLTASGIDWTKQKQIKERFFARGRRKELFAGPVLLVKEVIEAGTGEIPVALVTGDVRFEKAIFGIHAPTSDLALLKRIQTLLTDRKLVRFHPIASSSAYLVSKSSAVRLADLRRLPFPDSSEELALSLVEQSLIDDVLEHAADFKRKGEEATARQAPSDDQLQAFGELFCLVLGSVYPSLRADQPVKLPGGICYPFYFGESPSLRVEPGEAGETELDELLSASVGSSMRCQRILRVFHGNVILLVKPAQLRYWLRSIAIRDADELFVELQARGH